MIVIKFCPGLPVLPVPDLAARISGPCPPSGPGARRILCHHAMDSGNDHSTTHWNHRRQTHQLRSGRHPGQENLNGDRANHLSGSGLCRLCERCRYRRLVAGGGHGWRISLCGADLDNPAGSRTQGRGRHPGRSQQYRRSDGCHCRTSRYRLCCPVFWV